MIVFTVLESLYSFDGYEIVGIFTEKEKADKALQKQKEFRMKEQPSFLFYSHQIEQFTLDNE